MNTKDIEEIVGEFENALVFKDWPNKNVKGAGNWLRTTLTTLTQHHEAEVERVREEMAKEVKTVDDYLRRVTTFSIVTKDEIKKELCEVIDRRFEYLEEGLRKANQGITALTPTKTDKQTEV